MAAHGDQISKNRRRLFKALSAAPVVMTLRPGSALANSSTYQCLTSEIQAPPFIDGADPVVICGSADNCAAYVKLPYWIIPSDPPLDPSSCVLESGQALVRIDESTFVMVDSFTSTTMPAPAVSSVEVSETAPNVWTIVVNSTTCYQNVDGQEGYFLVTAPVTTDLAGNPNGYDLTSTQIKPALVQPQTPLPEVRGITQSCLMSVNSGSLPAPNEFLMKG